MKEDSHKTHTVKIPVILYPNRQIHRNGLAVAKGWIMRVINNGYRLSFYDNENVQNEMVVMGTQCEYSKNH